MATGRILFNVLLICVALNLAASDESKEDEKDNTSIEDTVNESFKGMSNFFKDLSEGVKDKADVGMETFKGLSSAAKDMTEDGVDKAKDWAEGLGESFSKVQEKFTETGEKIKETIGDAALSTKEEIESAASKLSKHAMGATGSMFKMLG